ncbi:MAG: putative toxin-antitoxin system toxin component, PIN family [Planctomycetes bacterium]|nr:putative toxin-antitoxin system toxin component, PIN family [Planctomycetota bacterium]
MERLDVVLDTNVLYSALYSNQGASFLLLEQVGRSPRFQIHLSVPLVLEYEEVLKRNSRILGLKYQDIDDVIDYLCSVAELHKVFFLWRPVLADSDDDMLLELAVEARCDRVVTHNTRDFTGIERFGPRAVTPQHFRQEIGVILWAR